jgi:diguanylate cyclase (GGDEF)-like protein/PAS domain S-box-containing protein
VLARFGTSGLASPASGFAARFAWLLYLVVGTGLGAAYLFLKDSPVHSGPAFNGIGLLSIGAILLAIRLHGVARISWILIAGGMAAFVCGDVVAYNYERFFGVELPFPSAADGFYLATYPMLILGLLVLVRRRTPSHDRAAMIDALIVSTSAGALSWALLIAPYARDGTLSLPTKLTSIAYPVMDLAVAACVARLAFGLGRRSPSLVFLVLGVVCLLVTDSVYGWALLHGGYATGGLLDGGWIAFYTLVGVAALHPNSRMLAEPVAARPFRVTTWRITGLAVCALVTPTVLAVEGTRDGGDVPWLAGCSGFVFLMVFLRMLDLGRRYEAALGRATVLAEAGVRLVEARSTVEVDAVATSAGRAMLGSATEVSLTDHDPTGRPDSSADLALPLQGRRKHHGVLAVDAGRPVDVDTQEAIRALANGVALALDGIEMADQLLRQRAEARFQALVQHSSDAILVVDAGGRIEYSSPSTRHVLGETQAELDRRALVELVAEHDRLRVVHALRGGQADGSALAIEFELVSARGNLEVEAICTNLLDNDDVGGIVLNIRDITERKSFERQLAHQAFHDEVTGLANRALFRDRVEHALERVRRGSSVAVLFIDVDDFKAVNDTLGHQVGDELLRIVAERIIASSRTIDTAARLGGDEFAVLLEDNTPSVPERVAERLLAEISAPIDVHGHDLGVTASIGIACSVPGDLCSVDELLRNADVAMYAAKADGKGVCRTFESSMHVALLGHLELKRELQRALERNEFELLYQPIVDLETEEIVSMEALIRWNHPTRGAISPASFIPIAEETGAIVAVGRWALEQAATHASRLLRLTGGAGPSVSVNISGRQLQESELVSDIIRILIRSNLPARKLVLEITETVMISDVELAMTRLLELTAKGIQVAVDDFGSGYSSLNYIRRFPINVLKIDRGFIADLNTSAEVASLTKTILDLATILDVIPVAEGIETVDQLAELRRLGCRRGQGYLFMKPVSAAAIEEEVLRRLGAAEPEQLIA